MLSGTGTPKDEIGASKIWKKAAELGFAAAQFNVGFLYLNGQGGFKKDVSAALRMFRRAADMNRGEMMDHNDELNRGRALEAIELIEQREKTKKKEEMDSPATKMIEAQFVGKRVVLTGLKKHPDLNGSKGVIGAVKLPFEEATNGGGVDMLLDACLYRFSVELDANGGTFNLKVDNIQIIL